MGIAIRRLIPIVFSIERLLKKQLKLDKANLTVERDEFKSSLESERAVTDSLSNQIINLTYFSKTLFFLF